MYLLLNLILIAFLLIVLWRTDPAGAASADLSIRFPTLLLVLLIINTVLFFRDYLRPCLSDQKRSDRAPMMGAARELLSAPVDEPAMIAVLERTIADCRARGACFLSREDADCVAIVARVGMLHASVTTGRILAGASDLRLRHPGGLGEEQIWSASSACALQSCRSRIGRFTLEVMPVRFAGQVVAWFVFEPFDERPVRRHRLEETTVFLQGVGALWFQQRHVATASSLDPVSRLPQFDTFQDALEVELERSERYSQNLTLLYLSVVLPSGGTGTIDDQLLQAAAQSLKDSLRRLDQAFVGEVRGRFAALLTETTPDVARLVADRIQTAFLRRVSQREAGKPAGVALRMGSATYPGDASHAAGLREKADEALQQAVAKGVNFVTYAGMDSPDAPEAKSDGVPYQL